MPGFRKSDLIDVDFVDALELASSGSGTPYKLDVPIVATTASSKEVLFTGPYNLLYEIDDPPAVGDSILIVSSSAAGTYTIAELLTTASLKVSEAIVDSTGGLGTFKHIVGSKKIGVDARAFQSSNKFTLQDVLKDFDDEIVAAGGGVNYDLILETEPADQHFVYDIIRTGNQVTQETWKRTSNSTLYKTIDYTYVGTRVEAEVRKIYAADGSTVVAQKTVDYIYQGNLVVKASGTRDI